MIGENFHKLAERARWGYTIAPALAANRGERSILTGKGDGGNGGDGYGDGYGGDGYGDGYGGDGYGGDGYGDGYGGGDGGGDGDGG